MKVPSPFPGSDIVLLSCSFATARSSFAVTVKSPTASASGSVPTAVTSPLPKMPFPLVRKTDTVLSVLFATTRSSLPSRLKSAATIACGVVPVAKLRLLKLVTGIAVAGTALLTVSNPAPGGGPSYLLPGDGLRAVAFIVINKNLSSHGTWARSGRSKADFAWREP